MPPFWTQGCLSPGKQASAVLEQHVSQLNLIKTFITLSVPVLPVANLSLFGLNILGDHYTETGTPAKAADVLMGPSLLVVTRGIGRVLI